MEYIVGALVVVAFGLLATRGNEIQHWVTERRLRRHTCHTRCAESRWCACGCRDGLYGDRMGTRCATCGVHVVSDEDIRASEITQENPAPKGFTSWGWERDREFRKARRDVDG